MSSESLDSWGNEHYAWSDSLHSEEYVVATYRIETDADPEAVAYAIAREQSATTHQYPGTGSPISHREDSRARVRSVVELSAVVDEHVPMYSLKTAVYAGVSTAHERPLTRVEIEIAYPIVNFGKSVTNLWNAVAGEIHRLGFLSAVQLYDLVLPPSYIELFAGPRIGTLKLFEEWGIRNRPIFCRSTRPAVGLTTAEMCSIAKEVLSGGFDAIKDDELTCDVGRSPAGERYSELAKTCRSVEQETGEKKIYFANIIDDLNSTFSLMELAKEGGADALMVAPALQGLSILQEIAQRSGLPLLAHNSWQDVATRNPRFGVSPAVISRLQRLCGADLVMLPGDFATPNCDREELARCVVACVEPLGSLAPALPILAGGKQAEGLSYYSECIGSTDFMMIVASAVDEHPKGLGEGAAAFRREAERLTC